MGNTTFINKLDFSNFLEKDSQETRYQKSNNEKSPRGLILMGKTGRPSRIRIDLDGGYKSSEEDWATFHEIMIDAMNQLEAAIKPELKKIKI